MMHRLVSASLYHQLWDNSIEQGVRMGSYILKGQGSGCIKSVDVCSFILVCII